MIKKMTKTQVGSVIPKGIVGSILFIDSLSKLAQDNAKLFWDETNNRLGVGTDAPSKALEVAGEIRATGDINASTNGSTTTSPRVFGYKDLTSGEACRFQFGDEHNGLQNGYAQDVQLYAYWGLVLAGGMQNYNSGFEPPAFTKTTDTGVLILSTNDIGDDPGEGATNIVTLGIKAIVNQTNNLTEWRNSAGAVLLSVEADGELNLIQDSKKISLGAGKDMSLFYDGTDGNIKTDEVAASDLKLDCGTEKTLELVEPVYKDINLGASQLARPASSQPDLESFVDEAGVDTGIETYGFAIGEKIHGSFEIQHDYKEGTDLMFHVHWQGITAPSGTDNVQWRLTYTFGVDGATLDATTIIDSPDSTIDAQYKFNRADFAAIIGTNLTIGMQILFTLERVASAGDAYSGDALIATVGVHYEVNTLGSRQAGIK